MLQVLILFPNLEKSILFTSSLLNKAFLFIKKQNLNSFLIKKALDYDKNVPKVQNTFIKNNRVLLTKKTYLKSSHSLQNKTTSKNVKPAPLANKNVPVITNVKSIVYNNYFFRYLNENLMNCSSEFYMSNKNVLDSLYLKYILTRDINVSKAKLYDELTKALIRSANIYNILSQENQVVSGVYIIYNISTDFAYIGKSWHVFKRFYEHKEMLLRGNHHNSPLQQAFDDLNPTFKSLTDCDSIASVLANEQSNNLFNGFIFLFLEVGLITSAQRSVSEELKIRTWPGELYNLIKYRS